MKASQDINVENKAYTLSMNGCAHVKVIQDSTVLIEEDSVDAYNKTFTPALGYITLELSNLTDGRFTPSSVQLEPLSFKTSHILTTNTTASREDGMITIPVNYTGDEGSIFMRFCPESEPGDDNRVLLEFGNIRIVYDDIAVNVYNQDEMILTTITLPEEGEWRSVLLSWKQNIATLLIEHDNNYEDTNLTDTFELTPSGNLCIGFSEYSEEHRANALIDDLYMTNTYSENIYDYLDGSISNPLVHLNFNGSVSNFNNTIVELAPSFTNHAPVILTKEDGTVMTKVSFTDPNTGNYVPYVIQKTKCALSNIFELYFDDIDTDKFKMYAMDSENNPIEVIELNGNKVTLSLSPNEKYGQYITIVYQPKNAYTIEPQEDDTFRIHLGGHDGQPLSIVYEKEKYNDCRLIENIDLNAMNNPNHDGFIYLTHEIFSVENINCTVAPKELKADGKHKAILIIECRDKYNNMVTDVDLIVTTEYGTITSPPARLEMIPFQQQAGRAIYHYTTPLIDASFDGYINNKITINAFKDNRLQMAIQTSIKLISI